ncbi:13554_t:CDS:1, partial [Cetraspora pellucida]
SYSFEETNEPEIGIWENDDFDSNYETDNMSSDENDTQENSNSEIFSSDTEDCFDHLNNSLE